MHVQQVLCELYYSSLLPHSCKQTVDNDPHTLSYTFHDRVPNLLSLKKNVILIQRLISIFMVNSPYHCDDGSILSVTLPYACVCLNLPDEIRKQLFMRAHHYCRHCVGNRLALTTNLARVAYSHAFDVRHAELPTFQKTLE